MMYRDIGGDKTPDGATYNKLSIKLAIEGMEIEEDESQRYKMTISKSQMYGLVINGTYVAKGSKETMKRMQKEKGGTVYNAPSKKVGDSEGKGK